MPAFSSCSDWCCFTGLLHVLKCIPSFRSDFFYEDLLLWLKIASIHHIYLPLLVIYLNICFTRQKFRHYVEVNLFVKTSRFEYIELFLSLHQITIIHVGINYSCHLNNFLWPQTINKLLLGLKKQTTKFNFEMVRLFPQLLGIIKKKQCQIWDIFRYLMLGFFLFFSKSDLMDVLDPNSFQYLKLMFLGLICHRFGAMYQCHS